MKTSLLIATLCLALNASAGEVIRECGTIQSVTQSQNMRISFKSESTGTEKNLALWSSINDKSTVLTALAHDLRVCVTYVTATKPDEIATVTSVTYTK